MVDMMDLLVDDAGPELAATRVGGGGEGAGGGAGNGAGHGRGGGRSVTGGVLGGRAMGAGGAHGHCSYEEVADTGHSENSGDDFDIFAFDSPAPAAGHKRSSASRGALNAARGGARGISSGVLGVPAPLGGLGTGLSGLGGGRKMSSGSAVERSSLLTDVDFLVS